MSLNEFIYKINRPCILKNILQKPKKGDNNSALEWNFENLGKIFQNEKFTFRIGRKSNSSKI